MSDPCPHVRISSLTQRLPAALGRLVLTAVVAAGLLTGCDEVRDYKTLSFFFDGVPLPPHMRPKRPEGRPDASAASEDQAREVTLTFYHTPFAKRQCKGCHRLDTGFNLTADNRNLCKPCHSSHQVAEEGDWMHGPVAHGMCMLCHEPHRSSNPGVLRAPQPDICFQCHDADRLKQDAFHAAQLQDPEMVCSKCHDPHGSGNRILLADARTYERRYRSVAQVRVTAHNDWSRETCAGCHDMGRGNKLLPEAEANCLSCHPKIKEPGEDQHMHQAVLDGKCLSCHNAHRSTRPSLLRPQTQDGCMTCHEAQKLPADPHANMKRVDCLICHQGHQSPRSDLLRPLLADVGAKVQDADHALRPNLLLPTRSDEGQP